MSVQTKLKNYGTFSTHFIVIKQTLQNVIFKPEKYTVHTCCLILTVQWTVTLLYGSVF